LRGGSLRNPVEQTADHRDLGSLRQAKERLPPKVDESSEAGIRGETRHSLPVNHPPLTSLSASIRDVRVRCRNSSSSALHTNLPLRPTKWEGEGCKGEVGPLLVRSTTKGVDRGRISVAAELISNDTTRYPSFPGQAAPD
jgi:hypothetical protein